MACSCFGTACKQRVMFVEKENIKLENCITITFQATRKPLDKAAGKGKTAQPSSAGSGAVFKARTGHAHLPAAAWCPWMPCLHLPGLTYSIAPCLCTCSGKVQRQHPSSNADTAIDISQQQPGAAPKLESAPKAHTTITINI